MRVLLLVSALGGNTPVEGWFDPTMRVTVLVVEYWDESPLPPYDVLVNAVSDA